MFMHQPKVAFINKDLITINMLEEALFNKK